MSPYAKLEYNSGPRTLSTKVLIFLTHVCVTFVSVTLVLAKKERQGFDPQSMGNFSSFIWFLEQALKAEVLYKKTSHLNTEHDFPASMFQRGMWWLKPEHVACLYTEQNDYMKGI